METHTTYEEYLDSQITDTDMFYLESEDLARQLVELGYRGSGDTLKREEFEARKKALRERSTQKVRVRRDPATPFIQVLPIDVYPYMEVLFIYFLVAEEATATSVRI